MDSITQGLLGAAAAQAALGGRLGRRTWIYGAVGGMAADLDILIRSGSDPLVALTYHRHFTHSLAFIPIGGVLAALPWILRTRHAEDRRAIVAATTVGYATHALLDALTTYGTQLWWPLSNARVALSGVSIVDLLFSVPLAWGVVRAARRVRRRPALVALAWCLAYLGFGLVQRYRAVRAATELATSRGHRIDRVDAFPNAFCNFVWRTAYRTGDRVYVDQARTPWWSATRIREGDSTRLVTIDTLPADLGEAPDLRAAFVTWNWFTDGWTSLDPDDPQVLSDLRYGLEIATVQSMWGLRLDPRATSPDRVTQIQRMRAGAGTRLGRLWRVVLGEPDVAP
jgi:inner membrane protein